MFLRDWGWGALLREGEDGGGGGSEDGADPGSEAGGGNDPADAKARNEAPVSLRAQLAEALTEDERPNFTKWAEKYTNDADFVKGVTSMRTQFDARVPVPGKEAKPEEVSKYFERVGKPRNAKDYKFDFGKGEDGKPVELDDSDKAALESFKEFAHQRHMTQGQFEDSVKFFQEINEKQAEQFSAQLDRAQDQVITELKAAWGPDFEANVEAAKAGGEVYSEDPDAWRDFVNLPLAGGMRVGDHPTFLKTMAKIGRASSEDQRVRNMRASGEADSVNDQIRAIEQEALEKGHSTAQEPYHSRLDALYKKLYPQIMQGSQGTGFGA